MEGVIDGAAEFAAGPPVSVQEPAPPAEPGSQPKEGLLPLRKV